jgi:hypothetical protein
MVPPLDTNHFSLLAAVNPQFCNSTADGTSDNKPCFIGMDSCCRIHQDLQNEKLTYLRRYHTILDIVLKPIILKISSLRYVAAMFKCKCTEKDMPFVFVEVNLTYKPASLRFMTCLCNPGPWSRPDEWVPILHYCCKISIVTLSNFIVELTL